MTGWIIACLATAAAAIWVWTFHRRTRDQLSQLTDAHTRRLRELEGEGVARADRLQRESAASKGELQYRLIEDLLPAIDALDSAVEQSADDDLGAGLALVVGEWERGLAKHDVERIAPQPGAIFDPAEHQAVDVDEDSEFAAGSVAKTLRCGWSSNDRVIRPALVLVSKAAAAAGEEE